MKNLVAWGLLVGLGAGVSAGCGSDANGSGGDDSGSDVNSNIDLDGGSDGGANGAGAQGSSGECSPVQGCNDLAVEFESIRPTMMILVDRSSSMFDNSFGESPSRWQPLKDTLVGEDGVVAQLQDSVRFGFATYTNRQADASCPLIDTVPIGYDNYEPIKNLYDEVSTDPVDAAPTLEDEGTYKGETPTGAAIQSVLPTLLEDEAPGPKYLMLVTDGEPDTCEIPDPQCGQYEAIAAVQEAYEQGITTFVVGVGDIGLDHLQALANAGVGQPVTTPNVPGDCPEDLSTPGDYAGENGNATYYMPESPDALKNDIGDLIGGVRSCTFDLSVEVDLDTANRGTVLLDCESVPYDDPNGWRMNSPTELEVLGNACGDIRTAADPYLFITFPCGSIVK